MERRDLRVFSTEIRCTVPSALDSMTSTKTNNRQTYTELEVSFDGFPVDGVPTSGSLSTLTGGKACGLVTTPLSFTTMNQSSPLSTLDTATTGTRYCSLAKMRPTRPSRFDCLVVHSSTVTAVMVDRRA